MAKWLSALLMASGTAAQVTTSVWYPIESPENFTFYGSVISAESDKLTVSLATTSAAPTAEKTFGSLRLVPTIVTMGPKTMGIHRTGEFGTLDSYSVGFDCTRSSEGADATCVRASGGAGAYNLACYGTRYLSTSTPSNLPEFCTKETALPESWVRQTRIQAASLIRDYPVILNAGLEKLSVTTGEGVSTTGAQTGSGAGSGSGSPASTSSPGLAAPTKAVAPALAGLGAAVAAFML